MSFGIGIWALNSMGRLGRLFDAFFVLLESWLLEAERQLELSWAFQYKKSQFNQFFLAFK